MYTDFLSLADLSTDEILELLELADRLKAELKAGKHEAPLAGQTLAMIFEKPSLRTRVTFEAGMVQLGSPRGWASVNRCRTSRAISRAGSTASWREPTVTIQCCNSPNLRRFL